MGKTNAWVVEAEIMLETALGYIKSLSFLRSELDFSSARALVEEGRRLQAHAPKKAYEKFDQAAKEAMEIPRRDLLGRLWKRADEIRPQIDEWRRAYTPSVTFEVLLVELRQIFEAVRQTHPITLLDLEESFEKRLEFTLTMAQKEVESLKRRGISPRSRKNLSREDKSQSQRIGSRGPGRYARPR